MEQSVRTSPVSCKRLLVEYDRLRDNKIAFIPGDGCFLFEDEEATAQLTEDDEVKAAVTLAAKSFNKQMRTSLLPIVVYIARSSPHHYHLVTTVDQQHRLEENHAVSPTNEQ